MNIPIVPAALSKIITNVQIDTISVNLHISASIQGRCLDANKVIVSVFTLTMGPADYVIWKANHAYMSTFVLAQLGFTAKPGILNERGILVEAGGLSEPTKTSWF